MELCTSQSRNVIQFVGKLKDKEMSFAKSFFYFFYQYRSNFKKGIYVEIKCQLDATEVFIANLIACATCFGNHYAHHQELKSIIQWLLPVVFRAVVFKLLVWCGAECYVSGLQDTATSTARNTTGSNHCIILLSSR